MRGGGGGGGGGGGRERDVHVRDMPHMMAADYRGGSGAFAVLSCASLCCAELCCALLCCAILCFPVLCVCSAVPFYCPMLCFVLGVM